MDAEYCHFGDCARCYWYIHTPPPLVTNGQEGEMRLIAYAGHIGIVRAPISTTGMQVASRLLLVWGVVNNFPFLATSPAYSSMLTAWSVTEVVRYSYFVFTLSGFQPAFISWLRYNTFFVLYPLGISSECWLIYKAIEPARKLRQEYAWVLQLILLVYIPGMSIEIWGETCD